MVKHIILWKLRSELTDAEKREKALAIKQGLESLKGQVPGLLDIHVQIDGRLETSNADIMLDSCHDIDAVICIGCVIQGETRHFEFICQAVSQGLTNVALKHQRPVIFSVLTTDTMEQALDRSGGKHGNKGVEGAVTALKMCAYKDSLTPEQ